jgi:hypothetical protein
VPERLRGLLREIDGAERRQKRRHSKAS